MKKLFLLGLLACAFAGNPEQAEAKSANVLNFQGTLKDAQEQVVNRSMKMTFKIYDTQTGGTALWTEDNQVTVKDGFFNVYLGTMQDLEVNFAKELYIEVTLDNGEVLPRTRLTASPFAINAGTASSADTAEVAKSVIDGVLTWNNFKAEALKVDGLIKGTFPNNLTIDWDGVKKHSIPSDKIAAGPMLHITATPGGKVGGDMTGEFPNPRLKNEVIEARHIQPNAVLTDKIKAGEANQVMVTDATGKKTTWSDNLALPGNLTVNGTTTLNKKLTVVAEGMDVTGDATFANDVTVTGKTTTGTLKAGETALGATTTGTLKATENATFDKDVAVTGKTTTGTLEAGATTLNGKLTAKAGADVTGDVAVTGKTTTGTLEAGATTLDATTMASAEVAGDVAVSGKTTTGTLKAGATTLTDKLTVEANGAAITGDVAVTGKTTTGTLKAGATELDATTMASAEVAGDIDVKGNTVLGTDNSNTIKVKGVLTPDGGTVTANALDGVVVNTANIADGAVTSAKIGTGEVKTANIANLNVTNEKIADATINIAKLAKSAGEGADAGKVLVLDVSGKPTYDNLKNGLNKAEPATTMGQVHYWDGAKWAVSKNIAPTDGQVLKYNETAGSLVWSEDAEIALPYEKDFTNFDKAAADKASDAIKIVKHNTDQYTGSVMNLELQKAGGAPAVKIKSQADLAHTNGALSVEATSTTDVTAKSTAMKVSNKADIKASEGTSAAMFDNYVKLDVGGKVHKGIDVVSKVDGASGTAVGVSAMATGGAKQVAVFATDDATLNPDKTAVVLAKGAGKDVLVVEGKPAAGKEYVATFKAPTGSRSVLIEGGGNINPVFPGKDINDLENAPLVVRNTAHPDIPGPGIQRTAIKTYGNIWTNSSVIADDLLAREKVQVGIEAGRIVTITPPADAASPAKFDRAIETKGIIADGNAEVKGNTVLGDDKAVDELTVNATSTFEAPATFNAGVKVDAVTTDALTVNNTAVIGNGEATDKLTVNAASEFQKAVTAKEAVTAEKAVDVAGKFTATDEVVLGAATKGTTVKGNLAVDKAATFNDEVTVVDTKVLNANGGITVDSDRFTVADGTGNVATKGNITQENANAYFIQQDSKGTKVHIGIDGAGTKNGYINLWADEKVDANANYALFEADATGAKVTNRIDATLAHQTGIGLVKAGPHTGFSVVGTGNTDNNNGVALTYKGNNPNEARILVNKAGTTVFAVDAEGDVTANALTANGALTAKEAATFKKDVTFEKDVTLNSGVAGTKANLNLTEGDVALTKGNVTVAAGNVAVTAGNVAVTTGNVAVGTGDVTVEDGNIKVGTAGTEKFTVDKNGNTVVKGSLKAGATTLASATVTGATNLAELTAGATTLASAEVTGLTKTATLEVTGTTSFKDNVTVEAGKTVTAPGGFVGNLTGKADAATLADKATNLAGGEALQIPIQTVADGTTFIPAPTDAVGDQVLLFNDGTNTVKWALSPAALTGEAIVNKINAEATTPINTNRLHSDVVLDSESPVGGMIGGKFKTGLTINNNVIEAAMIKANVITANEIATDAVTTDEIADGTIQAIDIKAGAVVEAKIADGAVTPAKIAKGTSNQVLVTNAAGTAVEWATKVNLAENANNATTATNLSGGGANSLVVQINTGNTGYIAHAGNNKVLTTNASGDIVWADQVAKAALANVATTANAVATNGVNEAAIQNDAVTTNKIKDNAVTSAKIANGTITADDLGTGSVGEDELAADAVTSAKIANGTITADDLGTGSVEADELASNAVTTVKIANGAVNTDKIAKGTSNQVLVTNAGGTAVEWADKVKKAEVADKANTVADGSISGGPNGAITDNTITAADLGTGSVEADELATNAVTTTKIMDKNVTSTKILGGTEGQVLVSGTSNAASWTKSLTGLTDLTATGTVILGGTAGNVTLGHATTGTTTINGTATVGKKLTVATEGIEVTAGNLVVATDKFKVDGTNGNTTVGGTLNVAEATTLAKKLTVSTGGLEVTAGGLEVKAGGARVIDGNFFVGSATNTRVTIETLSGNIATEGAIISKGNVTIGESAEPANLEVNGGTISLKNAGVEKFKVDATGAVTATSVTATTFNGALNGNAATATTATTATKLDNGAANQLVYQTGAGATAFLAAPTAPGQVLTWNGTNIAWAAPTNAQATAPVMTTVEIADNAVAGTTAPVVILTNNVTVTDAELGTKDAGTVITIIAKNAAGATVLDVVMTEKQAVTVISLGSGNWAVIK